MRVLVPLVVTIALSSCAALAVEAADTPENLADVVREQMRRIEALESRVAELQQEVGRLRQGPAATPGSTAEAPAAARAEDEDETALFDHAKGGEAPKG